MQINREKGQKMRNARTKEDFEEQRNKYYEQLLQNPIPKIPSSGNSLTLLGEIVRQVKQPVTDRKIGIYSDISYFEAVNRIATDMVFWQGIESILRDWEGISSISYCLGNENDSRHGDFYITDKDNNVFEGEVFFVSQSFFYEKLRRTVKKWENRKLTYIIFNGEAVSNFQRLQDRHGGLTFVTVNIV